MEQWQTIDGNAAVQPGDKLRCWYKLVGQNTYLNVATIDAICKRIEADGRLTVHSHSWPDAEGQVNFVVKVKGEPALASGLVVGLFTAGAVATIIFAAGVAVGLWWTAGLVEKMTGVSAVDVAAGTMSGTVGRLGLAAVVAYAILQWLKRTG